MARRQLGLEEVLHELSLDPGSDEEPFLDDNDGLLSSESEDDHGGDERDGNNDDDGSAGSDESGNEVNDESDGNVDGDGPGSEENNQVLSEKSHTAAAENLDPHDDGSEGKKRPCEVDQMKHVQLAVCSMVKRSSCFCESAMRIETLIFFLSFFGLK